MLPFGVIARTQKYFGKIPVVAEITHHQLIVATTLASDTTLFYSGLLHDILKPLLRFRKMNGKWRWWHLNYNLNDKEAPLADLLRENQAIEDLSINKNKLLEIIQCHHPNPWCKKKKLLKNNPINYVENRLGLPVIESTILPRKELNEMGLYTCVEARGLNHSYHYFVLNLLYQAIKYRLNRIYGEIFSSFGLNKLIVDYYFGEDKMPIVNYNSGVLSIAYFIPSERFKGIHIRHEYGSDLTFNVSESGDTISISFGWSDVLVFTTPYMGGQKASYRILCVIPGLVKYINGRVGKNSKARHSFEALASKAILDVIMEIESNIGIEEHYGKLVLDYLGGNEDGDYICVFCGKRADREVKLSRSGLLSGKFTDYHRISGSVETLKASVCPLCHVGFKFEEKFRKQGPSFLIPLASEPVSVRISSDFADKFKSLYGDVPLNINEGIVLSILGYSTLQLISEAWYTSLLREVNKYPINLPWIKAHTPRAQKDISRLYFNFLVSRKVLLYPLIIKVRPRAIISSYGGRNKKFILNTDILEGHILWRGEEQDLTEEQLDALEPILKETSKSKIGRLRKIYGRMVGLYGLRG